MEIKQHNNLTQFLAFFAQIKTTIREWRLVNISLGRNTKASIFYIAKQMWTSLREIEGEIFICNSHELLALVKTGEDVNVRSLQKEIQNGFPEYACQIEVVETTKEGLQKIELRLRDESTAHAGGGRDTQSLLLKERQNRRENVILIADDDMFMRSLVTKALEAHGEITVLEDGAGVVDAYLKILPDIVYLDIHLPVHSGIEILEEILMFDQHAHIIMLSADSGKENVLNTRRMGAKGFIAKPFTREKLEEVLWKCPTITKG